MKKIIAGVLIAAFMLATAESVQAETGKGRGGIMGFVAGCCFGIRAGADYNSGKEIHWREWVTFIPYAGLFFTIWNGVDGANGVSRADYEKQYGSTFY